MALANDRGEDWRGRMCFEKLLDLIQGLEDRGGRLIITQFHTTYPDGFFVLLTSNFARPAA
jgi:hypothetical protein